MVLLLVLENIYKMYTRILVVNNKFLSLMNDCRIMIKFEVLVQMI